VRPSARSRPGDTAFAAGGLLLVALAGAALTAPALWPEPHATDLDRVLAPPSWAHPFGTDALGRDLLARIAHGGRVSLAVGGLATLLAVGIGVPLGALAGARGRFADAAVSRAVEAVLCFPSLILALALLASSPSWLRDLPDPLRIAAVLGVTGWAVVARFLRGEVRRVGSTLAVEAARATGAGGIRILTRHVLPAALAPVLVTAAFGVGAAVLLESALSFLGLGVRIPTATWGAMLAESRNVIGLAWWAALFPGAALVATVLACNLVGEGLRRRLDPRLSAPESRGPDPAISPAPRS
jgi:peptide/nickel transport system permease protein